MDLSLILPLIIVIVLSVLVYFDAKSIGVRKTGEPPRSLHLDTGPAGWAAYCLFFSILGFPIYLTDRARFKQKFQSPTRPSPSVPQSSDYKQELRKLAKLKDDGIISLDGVRPEEENAPWYLIR